MDEKQKEWHKHFIREFLKNHSYDPQWAVKVMYETHGEKFKYLVDEVLMTG